MSFFRIRSFLLKILNH